MADLDPLEITTAQVKEVAGIHRRANENVTRKYFNFGNFTNFQLNAAIYINATNSACLKIQKIF